MLNVTLTILISRRKEIIKVLQKQVLTLTKSNLPIFGVQEKSLAAYVHQEKDHIRGIRKLPSLTKRLYVLDLVSEDQTRTAFGIESTSDKALEVESRPDLDRMISARETLRANALDKYNKAEKLDKEEQIKNGSKCALILS